MSAKTRVLCCPCCGAVYDTAELWCANDESVQQFYAQKAADPALTLRAYAQQLGITHHAFEQRKLRYDAAVKSAKGSLEQ